MDLRDKNNPDKIRVAFICYDGLSTGGTQKFLQTIAANLDKEEYSVDYFYCEPATTTLGPQYKYPGSSLERKKYLETNGVNLIEFFVNTLDLTSPYNNWVGTNFWEKFDESKYDMIQTGRAGHKEYPFTNIRTIPIIDSIHLTAGVDNQFNISRVMHITNWSAKKWIAAGGDSSRIEIVSHPMEIDDSGTYNLRKEMNIPESAFIYGFHQRVSNEIFSPIPLEAYKKIENEDTHFMIMGGGDTYRNQATQLGIKNISFLDHSTDRVRVFSFLKTLNVYAHGRKDGEVNSTAMAEAMYFGLPIISHTSPINNGHIECIGNAGVVVETTQDYAEQLRKIHTNKVYFQMRSKNARQRFIEMYDLDTQIRRIMDIYQSVYKDPFPNYWYRIWTSLHWTQNIRNWLKYCYRKLKHQYNDMISKL